MKDFTIELSFKRVMILVGAVAAFITASVTILNATKSAEPFWIAHRAFVREAVSSVSLKMAGDVHKVESRQISTQVQMAKSARRDIQSKIEDKQLLLKQNPDTPSSIRSAIDEQIRSLKEEYEDLSATIGDLVREQSQRRP